MYPFPKKLLLAGFLLVPPVFATTVHKAPASRHTSNAATAAAQKKHSKARPKKTRGQQSIDPERVTQIQQALIREHYLSGDPSGNWDAQTQAAMQKYQADRGWQTRLIPDARAIKNLGLGPDYSSAINAAGASFNPPPFSSTPSAQTAGFAQAAGIPQ